MTAAPAAAPTASATTEKLGDLRPPSSHYARFESAWAGYTIRARPGFKVGIERDEGGVTVVDRETGIYGRGEDASAALRDFARAVMEHLDVLERQAALSEELSAQLSYIRRRVA